MTLTVTAGFVLAVHVDGSPHAQDSTRSAIMASDMVLIPVQPSPFDVWAARVVVEWLSEAAIIKPSLRTAFAENWKIVNIAVGCDVTEAWPFTRCMPWPHSWPNVWLSRRASGVGAGPYSAANAEDAQLGKKFWSPSLMAKKVPIAHPSAVAVPDDWGRQKPAAPADIEPLKRLTVDIPESLHTKIKIACATKRQKMSEAVRTLLEREWGDEA